MSFSYANPTSGPSAGGIGWFNFDNLTLNPGDSFTGLKGTLKDGSVVTFDIAMALISGTARTVTAVPVPTWNGTFFGSSNYTGLLGNEALKTSIVYAPGSLSITLSNIVVKDADGNLVPNYTALVADAESTGIGERWTWDTTGGAWKLFTTLGNSSSPPITGIGTPSVSFTGNAPANQNDYVLSTQSPSQLILNSNTTVATGGSQAIAIGFAVTKITVQKNVGQRIDAADQFVLDIAGKPAVQEITAGGMDGIQMENAVIYGIPGNSYTVNETMASGSVSVLNEYTSIISATNATPAGSIPPTGVLPVNFTPVLGDNIIYTFLNAAPESFSKTVDKAHADIGDVLTYTVTVNNPNNFTINNVFVTDATPVGTTYLGNLIVSAPFTGMAPASGITITSIGPDDAVTISWQVQVNSTPSVPTPITNLANVTIPEGITGVTNVVSTKIAHAFISTLKSVNKSNANVNDTLTYRLILTNNGNATANRVVLTDPVPTGMSYVTGSIIGSVPFTGTLTGGLTLTAPIPPGGNATISYKVKVGSSVPAVNPIPNRAFVTYAYTVDPATPNGVTASGSSNTVTTQVSTALLTTVKKADKVMAYIGDVITYQVALTNIGNVPASNVILIDIMPNGTSYVMGSLASDVVFTGSPLTTIHLTHAIEPGETIAFTYQFQVTGIPNPNPIANKMKVTFAYTVNPLDPDGVIGSSVSNTVNTVVFRNNYEQEISDVIHSIALQEAAIGNIANAEGAKIQRMLAMGASPNELLCVNKSVSDMLEALGTLESILKQKLSSVDCQISPTCM